MNHIKIDLMCANIDALQAGFAMSSQLKLTQQSWHGSFIIAKHFEWPI
jgi:hypothetical protein